MVTISQKKIEKAVFVKILINLIKRLQTKSNQISDLFSPSEPKTFSENKTKYIANVGIQICMPNKSITFPN